MTRWIFMVTYKKYSTEYSINVVSTSVDAVLKRLPTLLKKKYHKGATVLTVSRGMEVVV